MPGPTRKLKVFLCHATQDKPIVRDLYQRLASKDWIDPWLDEEKLLPGQKWNIEIPKAVEAADVVIICLSTNSVSKEGYAQRELSFALDVALSKPEETIFIIPLRFDDCQPPSRLHDWHYANYFPPERRDWAFGRLIKSLEVRVEELNILTAKLVNPPLAVIDELITLVTDEPQMQVQVHTNVTRPGLNLRQLPSTSADILGVEAIGSMLRVLDHPDEARARIGKVGQWIFVKDNKGRRGYVGAAYVIEVK